MDSPVEKLYQLRMVLFEGPEFHDDFEEPHEHDDLVQRGLAIDTRHLATSETSWGHEDP